VCRFHRILARHDIAIALRALLAHAAATVAMESHFRHHFCHSSQPLSPHRRHRRQDGRYSGRRHVRRQFIVYLASSETDDIDADR